MFVKLLKNIRDKAKAVVTKPANLTEFNRVLNYFLGFSTQPHSLLAKRCPLGIILSAS